MFQGYFSKVKEFKFSLREQKEIFISAIVFGFILSIRKWGPGQEVDILVGFSNWLFASIAIGLIMFISISLQKMSALNDGYNLYYHWWSQGILIGFLISFVSFGLIPILYPGVTIFEHRPGSRLGRFRYGTTTKDMAMSGLSGIVANILVAAFAGLLFLATNSYWVLFFIKISLIYAFFSILPLPKASGIKFGEGATPGFHLFFFSRNLYIFIFFTTIAYIALLLSSILIFGSILALIISIVLGLLGLLLFSKFIEKSF